MDPERDSVDSPAILYDLTFGYVKAELLMAGVNLGIFEALVEKPLSYPDIAKKLDIPMKHLDKILNAQCLLKLLDKTYEGDTEYYGNSVTTKLYLVKDSPECLIDFLRFSDLFKGLTGQFTECIKSGSQVMSKKDSNIFYLLENDMETRRVFQGGMANISRTSRFAIEGLDLNEFKEHIDLGGGTGTFARLLADKYPEKKVSVCDLKRVCDTAGTIPLNKNSRINFIPGDFFKGDLPPADMYSMCHVIHDWDDDDADKILGHVFKAVRPGGGLLILDSVFNDDKVGPIRVNLTEIGQIPQHDGKHRTFKEFTTLLEKHGFVNAKLKRWDGFGFYDSILARKPAAGEE